MRQLLISLPPFMVSAKWASQLSRPATLPSAAAMPPSAITVWALPSSDLHRTSTRAPPEAAAMAALIPAPPAPMTSTSVSTVSYETSATLAPRSGRKGTELEQADVEVHSPDREHADPGPTVVADVEHGHALPQLIPGAVAAEAVEPAPGQVAESVTAERVAGETHDVDEHQHVAQAEVERAVVIERDDRVEPEHRHLERGDVERKAVQVVEDEEAGLAPIRTPARLLDRT